MTTRQSTAIDASLCQRCGGDLANLDVEPCEYHLLGCEVNDPSLSVRICTCGEELWCCPGCCPHCNKGANLLESDEVADRIWWVVHKAAIAVMVIGGAAIAIAAIQGIAEALK